MNRLLLQGKRLLADWLDRPLRGGVIVGRRYRIDELLGIGSYGLTYRCTDLLRGRPAALKQAKPSKGAAARELLRREAGMLERLDHPAIPRALALLEERGQLFLASELAAGVTLEDWIFEQGRTFSEAEALRLVRSLAEIVGHVHKRGYVHLDVRIPNVLAKLSSSEFGAPNSAARAGFASGDSLSLIDFGLARRIGEPPLALASADEHDRRRAPAEPASDLHDLGELLLFLLYSSYEPAPGAPERGWEEELELTPQARRLLRRLLGSDGPPLSGVPELLEELDRMLAAR
ncbi:protein kinase domain-containing protein [Paenibacillus pasadenensis]|uniref:protein kinase domain-containing protein n=1 Tax=Paenibacillus TaxID=44249 RepID=UPI00040A8BC2|nr:protein kinase [Paenibacillus pasadenensis]